jgi:hypothetical protein
MIDVELPTTDDRVVIMSRHDQLLANPGFKITALQGRYRLNKVVGI